MYMRLIMSTQITSRENAGMNKSTCLHLDLIIEQAYNYEVL